VFGLEIPGSRTQTWRPRILYLWTVEQGRSEARTKGKEWRPECRQGGRRDFRRVALPVMGLRGACGPQDFLPEAGPSLNGTVEGAEKEDLGPNETKSKCQPATTNPFFNDEFTTK